MNKSILFILFFCITSLPIHAQSQDELIWHEGERLRWSDFSGEADTASRFSANTSFNIQCFHNIKCENGSMKVTMRIIAVFFHSKSWVQKNQENSDLLKHEQTHFDIAEIAARNLRKKIFESHFSKSKLDANIKSLVDITFHDVMEMQNKYDKESEHYMNKEGQAQWNEYVEKELKNMSPYSSDTVTIENQSCN